MVGHIRKIILFSITVSCLILKMISVVQADDSAVSAKFVKPLTVTATTDGKIKIEFAVSSPTDVEVAILDEKGVVLRHLAAGVLGLTTLPPLPLTAGLAQNIAWDGKDNYGQDAVVSKCSVRVRIGMGVKLNKIAGGNPYAFYSKDMGQGDHAKWQISGLEAKADGNVYLMGNTNNYGPLAIRQYDPVGNYKRTVFPIPAMQPIEKISGWGINIREDGTYTPKRSEIEFPSISTTPMACSRHDIAGLLPSADTKTLLVLCPTAKWNTPVFNIMTIGTDSSIALNSEEAVLGPIVSQQPLEQGDQKLHGFPFISPTVDGKYFYLSGVFASPKARNNGHTGALPDGFWRDGQVWKVDAKTRVATPFFSLEESKVITDIEARGISPISDSKTTVYAALHGVAESMDGHVLICDRQNKRVVVLDKNGKVFREIPVLYPDAIAINPKSKALYVTTRYGNYGKQGELHLLKFNDWSVDSAPSLTLPLCKSGVYTSPSYLAVSQDKGDVLVWVAYTQLPARIYRDTEKGLELVKDFYEVGHQRELDMQHISVDPKTEKLYIADGHGYCYKIDNWNDPRFELCMIDEKTKLRAVGLAIDVRNRFLYCYPPEKYGTKISRYTIDGEYFVPAPINNSSKNEFSPGISIDWNIGLGYGVRGLAVAPDGGLATLSVLAEKSADVSGPLTFFKSDQTKVPWEPMAFEKYGKPISAGVKFDFHGNLYVGKTDKNGPAKKAPVGFEKDTAFRVSLGSIYKYNPTGSLQSGNLYPAEPALPAKVYDVLYGSISLGFARTPRFGLDGYGRIYYPTSFMPQVSVIDNEGNNILSFGTYGNRDSMGGLEGDLIPTTGIPLGQPNSVEATDDWVYIGDILNIRILRLAKTFMATEVVKIK